MMAGANFCSVIGILLLYSIIQCDVLISTEARNPAQNRDDEQTSGAAGGNFEL
jgi:hypothetical protein